MLETLIRGVIDTLPSTARIARMMSALLLCITFREEGELEARFGKDHVEYQKRVHFPIPGMKMKPRHPRADCRPSPADQNIYNQYMKYIRYNGHHHRGIRGDQGNPPHIR